MDRRLCLVGGGFSGILTSAFIPEKNFVVLESGDELGGRLRRLGHQIRSEEARDILSRKLPEIQWQQGSQTDFEGENKKTFWFPEGGFAGIRDMLLAGETAEFRTKSLVTSVNLEARELSLIDGRTVPYEKLVWCGTYAELKKVLGPSEAPESASAKMLEAFGAPKETRTTIQIEITTDAQDIDKEKLSLRFKHKGTPMELTGWYSGGGCYAWVGEVPEDVAFHSEETAKLITACARELGKRFPSTAKAFQTAKRVFLHEEDLFPKGGVEKRVESVTDGLLVGRPIAESDEEVYVLDHLIFNTLRIAEATMATGNRQNN